MKKLSGVIVEHRYTGDLPFPSWKEWHKWKVYRNIATAQMALDTLNRKHKNFEFRIKG